MNRSGYPLTVAMLVGLLVGQSVVAAQLPFLLGGAAMAGETELVVTPQGVRLQVAQRPLRDVLARIQQESGIRFELSQGVMNVPITATVEAADWPTAIKRLLRQFSRAEMWDRKNELLHVMVIERGQEREITGSAAVEERADNSPKPEASDAEAKDRGVSEAPEGVAFLQILSSRTRTDPNLTISPGPLGERERPSEGGSAGTSASEDALPPER